MCRHQCPGESEDETTQLIGNSSLESCTTSVAGVSPGLQFGPIGGVELQVVSSGLVWQRFIGNALFAR